MRVYYPKLGEYPESNRAALCKVEGIVYKSWDSSEVVAQAPMWSQAIYHEGKWHFIGMRHSTSAIVLRWCYMDELIPEAMR